MKLTMRTLAAATLLAITPLAPAATPLTNLDTQATAVDTAAMNKGQTQVAAKIAAFFTTFAGSTDNATALVTALRNGTDVTLTTTTPATGTGTTPTTTTTTFTPPTGKMGWGNVKIALALAQDSLLKAGITNPTSAQVQAALLGGDVAKADGTTVTLKGVLQMRADGMGWGQIAHAGGTNVGHVVSSLKRTQTQIATLPATRTTATTTAASMKGITTAAATTGANAATKSSSSKGITTATAASANAQGLVTAEGTPAGSSVQHGNAYGRGIVTAAGGGSTPMATSANGGGKASNGTGVITGNGGGIAASGLTSAHGNSGGNGQGAEHGKGKGGG